MRSWQMITSSVRGPGKPRNQDALAWTITHDGSHVLVAVADGHGSAAHPRSDVGAKLAVEAFLTVVCRFDEGLADLRSSRAKFLAEDNVPRDIVREWQEEVIADLARTPVPDAVEPEGQPALTLYGSTLIGALLTPELVLAWQLGDGDLCLLDESGPLQPLAPTGRAIGDETLSLCSDDAHLLVRTFWSPRHGGDGPPPLIALSTDGLSNSFANHDGYLQFVNDIHGRLENSGTEPVRADLTGWLERASGFSGDDTTLALAWWGTEGQPERPPERPMIPVREED